MRNWVTVGLVIATAACGREDAEGWAKDKLGQDAETLRKECMNQYELSVLVPGGIQPDPATYLPHPTVVLEPPPTMRESRHLRFHRVNPKLDEPIESVRDVKSCAVVSYGIWDASRFERTKTGHVAWIPDGKPFIQVVAIDRATGQGRLHVSPGDGDSDTIDLLARLPRSAP